MWSLNTTQAPGSRAALSNPNVVNPTFTADVAGTYIAQLIVKDGTISSQPVTVSVSTNVAPPPTANAGPNQKVGVGATVHLQGTGTDPQNLPLNYTWSLPTRPTGSNASLSATNVQNPTFAADLPGTYTAQLIVNNGTLFSQPSLVTITSSATPPGAVPTTSTPSVAVGSLALPSALLFAQNHRCTHIYGPSTFRLVAERPSVARMDNSRALYPIYRAHMWRSLSSKTHSRRACLQPSLYRPVRWGLR